MSHATPAVADIDTPGSDRIRLFTSPRFVELVKSIPGARHDPKTGTWTMPLSWASCLALRGTFGDGLTVGPALNEWGFAHRRWIEAVNEAKAGHARPAGLPERLYEFQPAGISFLVESERCVLADEQGTGKTVQTILALQHLHELWMMGGAKNPLPALVVATKSMVHKWAEEFEAWWPGLDVRTVTGTAAARKKALAPGGDIYIIGWAGLKGHSRLAPYGSTRLTDKQRTPAELNGGWLRTVIADEAHKAKDPKAQQTRAWWAVAHEAHYRWALTGTPLANAPDDTWSLMHGVAPEEYPSKRAYVDRYLHAGLNFFGGLEVYGLTQDPAKRAEFFGFFDPRFFRRTKAEVLQHLPPKVRSRRVVEMDPKQAKAYGEMKDHMMTALDSGLLITADPLVKLGRLLQIAAALPVLDADGNVVELDEPSCKVDALLDILDEAPGEPLVVFAESRKLIELCARVLDRKKVSYGLITGQIDAATRAASIAEFQAGERQVILATTGAGGEGITLTRANRLVFLQRSWSMIQNLQAEDRIHRIGQESSVVEIIDVVTRGTAEDSVHAAVAEKEGRLAEITRDPERLRALLEGSYQ